MTITSAPSSVPAGSSFSVSYSFRHPKTGGVVGITPPGRNVYSVAPLSEQMASAGFLTTQPMSGASGTVTLVAPSTPGDYSLQTFYGPDGGTEDIQSLQVTAAAAAAPPPPSSSSSTATSAPASSSTPSSSSTLNPWANAPAGVYVPPSPEPAASDGARLSAQGTDVQAYYVANAGPGMLAATQFVIDHEHQLAAIGASQHPTTTYTPPPTEPAASDGEKLSMQSPDVQAYYVQKYGPGFLAATGFVNERNASLGTSIPGGASTVLPLPAGPGAGGADTGLFTGGAGGGDFSSTSTTTPPVPTTSAAGGLPPSFGNLVHQVEANPPLLIGLGIGLYFLLGGQLPGSHRR